MIIRLIFGGVMFLAAGALTRAAYDEYRVERLRRRYVPPYTGSSSHFACLVVLAVIAVVAGLGLMRII